VCRSGTVYDWYMSGSKETQIAGKPRRARNRSVQKAIKQIRRLRRPLPHGFKFDRIEAHER